MSTPITPLKTVLFVDFDNIYLGLKQLDEAAAERFGTDPGRWLAWMERGMPASDEEDAELRPRQILVRRCYLNPRDFGKYRPNFTRTAFNVIDCPPLTMQGKNSADIYMVMDIIDALEHKTRFDEFIILSGDADFTPVLLRLRGHDRRTAVLAAGPASEAYKAACDLVIQEDVFIEYALGMTSEIQTSDAHKRSHGPVVTPPRELMDAIAAKLYAEASANGEILATDLPRLYLSFPEFRRDSNWLGFFSLRALTNDLTKRHPTLRLTEGDPWRVTVQMPARPAPTPDQRTEVAESPAEDALRQRIIQQVKRLVAEADEPIVMARAAHEITAKLGPQVIESRWAGAGTFKALLQSAVATPGDDAGFAIAGAPSPGFIYDPDRHDLPLAGAREEPRPALPPGLDDLVGRIHQATGTPDLTPTQYAVLFDATADELKENPYNLTQTSKAVRDRCIERGESISRGDVSFVLKGIIYKGHRFGKRDTAAGLAKEFRTSVMARCEDVEIDLSAADKKLIEAWILGGLSSSK